MFLLLSMFFIGIVLASLLASCDAGVWNFDNAFVAQPLPTSSNEEYVNHLVNCSKLFHSLVENCGDGKTDCPLLTDRTPPSPASDANTILTAGATAIEKLMAFFDYNVDPEIRDGMGYLYGDINKLHQSDFDKATDTFWQCTRLNYRHLFHYEFATSGEIDKQMMAIDYSTYGPLAEFLINPQRSYNITNGANSVCEDGLTYLILANTISERVPWSPTKVIYTNNAIDYRYLLLTKGGFELLPFSKFYLFQSFARNMQLALAAKTILTGNTFIDYVTASFDVTKQDPTIANVIKAQMKQFINKMTAVWGETEDVNQRYHLFSKWYFTATKNMPWLGWHLGSMTLGFYGQLGDFFYLNYFFGFPQ
uniref:Phospholipase B-like n=1 Tax=Panagrellus redivivus TaxID=6233 RepID=A0A7E4UY74_PANRE